MEYIFVEEYEGFRIFSVGYISSSYEKVTKYNLGTQGASSIAEMFEMSYMETLRMASDLGATTMRKLSDGKVYSNHMDFDSLDGVKLFIDTAKSARIMANLNGNFSEDELEKMTERFKKGGILNVKR